MLQPFAYQWGKYTSKQAKEDIAKGRINDVPLTSLQVHINKTKNSMPKFLIERDWPDAGLLSQDELKEMAQQSCEVLSNMPARVHWVHSYVTDNKLYCVYIAPDEEALLEHASYGGFSARKISMVKQIIDPVTAEGIPLANSDQPTEIKLK